LPCARARRALGPRSCPMGCKSSKLAELREAREELAQANARIKELEAARRARASEFVSKRRSRGGGSPNLSSSSSSADSSNKSFVTTGHASQLASSSSSSKTDSLSQAMAELEDRERSPRDKLLAKFAAKEAAAIQVRELKVVTPKEVSPEISRRAPRRRTSKERFSELARVISAGDLSPASSSPEIAPRRRSSKERLGNLALSIERSSPILAKAARRRRSSKELSAEALAAANAPPAQPEVPTPTAVRDLMSSMSRAGRKFAEENQMPLEQELAGRQTPTHPHPQHMQQLAGRTAPITQT
jgi:hypothetical protein